LKRACFLQKAAGLVQAVTYFIGLSSFEMMAMFRRGLFYSYLTIYLRHFLGLSVTETTLFATLPMTMNILAQTFIWGRISDRFQLRRTLIIYGEVLAAAGTVGIWFLHRLPQSSLGAGYAIIVGLTVVEIFWSMSNIAWSALVSDMYGATERSRIQGRLSSMGGIGRMLGVWIGGLMYDGFGLTYAGWGFHQGWLFFISAAVMIISTVPLRFLPEGGACLAPGVSPSPDTLEHRNTSLRVYLTFLIALVFINFGRNSVAIIFPQYLALENGLAINSRTLSYIINSQSLSIILFGWGAGWIGRKLSNAAALLWATGAAIAALLIVTFSQYLPLLYLSSFLRGIGDVLVLACAYGYASVLIPAELRARRFAWFNATFFLSWGLAGTLIAGPLVDALIGIGYTESIAYRASFAAAAVITLIGLSIMAALTWHQRRRGLPI
jgi:MFS family permease